MCSHTTSKLMAHSFGWETIIHIYLNSTKVQSQQIMLLEKNVNFK